MNSLRGREGERGSAAVEITLVAPVLVLFVMVVIFGGRLALARQAVQAAPTKRAIQSNPPKRPVSTNNWM